MVLEFHCLRKIPGHTGQERIRIILHGVELPPPGALGNRSILASPLTPGMKDILNKKVKHREEFRPFAPVAPLDRAGDYFHLKQADPYMTILSDVKDGRNIPSVTHVDGTARLQTVDRAFNPRYYDLITAFGKKSGVPVLINTSFNVQGEPLVCTPEQAYRCFMGTDIDLLVLGNYIIE